jgi:transposase
LVIATLESVPGATSWMIASVSTPRTWSNRKRTALAGVNPIEASSGRITRHRLNRFGDRGLNQALHTIVNWRMIHGHEATQHYLARQRARAQQRTDGEIRRCLKRYAARPLFRLMETAAST